MEKSRSLRLFNYLADRPGDGRKASQHRSAGACRAGSVFRFGRGARRGRHVHVETRTRPVRPLTAAAHGAAAVIGGRAAPPGLEQQRRQQRCGFRRIERHGRHRHDLRFRLGGKPHVQSALQRELHAQQRHYRPGESAEPGGPDLANNAAGHDNKFSRPKPHCPAAPLLGKQRRDTEHRRSRDLWRSTRGAST